MKEKRSARPADRKFAPLGGYRKSIRPERSERLEASTTNIITIGNAVTAKDTGQEFQGDEDNDQIDDPAPTAVTGAHATNIIIVSAHHIHNILSFIQILAAANIVTVGNAVAAENTGQEFQGDEDNNQVNDPASTVAEAP